MFGTFTPTAEDATEYLYSRSLAAEGITEDLKDTNQMEWVARMNNIHSRVTEIVNNELILT